MGTENLMTEAMLASPPVEAAPPLRPVDAPWVFPGRPFFNRFRRRGSDGVPLFFTDGLSSKEEKAFHRRHPDLSLIFAYYEVGDDTVALIWHPRYEIIHATRGLVYRSASVNPTYEAARAEGFSEKSPVVRLAERSDYRIALRVFDCEAHAVWTRAHSYAAWLRNAIDQLGAANAEAWLRRQLEGLEQ